MFKKWLIRMLSVVVAFLIAFVAVGLFLPTTYEVSSTITINATQDRVHALVADLNAWPKWEPWTENDSTVKTTVGERATGIGASQTWTDKTGGGELIFTKSDPATGVEYDLIFGQQYVCTAQMAHAPGGEPGTTTVNWSMQGDAGTPVIGGYFALMMPGMIQPMFDRGLERLKQAAEAQPVSGTPEEPASSDDQGRSVDEAEQGMNTAEQPRSRIVGKSPRLDVEVLLDESQEPRWVNITAFNDPQAVYGHGVSPSGRWLFVWHATYPPRQLSIYDLESRERRTNFEPGFGGRLQWSAYDTLVHIWGCGTNCVNYQVYDVAGGSIAGGYAGGGNAISPDGTRLALYTSLPGSDMPYRELSLEDGRLLMETTVGEQGQRIPEWAR